MLTWGKTKPFVKVCDKLFKDLLTNKIFSMQIYIEILRWSFV